MTKKQFNRLRPEKRRIALAKDVLQQLKAEKLIPVHMQYIRFPFDVCGCDSGKTVMKNASCEVCAKGALICAYVARFNDYTVSEMKEAPHMNQDMIEVFGLSLWNAIEALYEGWIFHKSGGTDVPDVMANENSMGRNMFIETFPEHYNGSRRQWPMETLMRNIIHNKGKLNYSGVLIG